MEFTIPNVINDCPTIADIIAMGHKPGQHAKRGLKIATIKWKRTRLAEAQNWHCCWCACKLTDSPNYPNSATVEHVTPRSIGGTDDMDNLAVACNSCNTKRGVIHMNDFDHTKPVVYPRDNQRARQERKRTSKTTKSFNKLMKNGWVRHGRKIDFYIWISTCRMNKASAETLKAEYELTYDNG